MLLLVGISILVFEALVLLELILVGYVVLALTILLAILIQVYLLAVWVVLHHVSEELDVASKVVQVV